MRYYLAVLLLLCAGSVHAQDDADPTVQKAKAALDKAQADYDAALKARKKTSNTAPAPPATPSSHRLLPIDTDLAVYEDGTVGLAYSYQGKSLQSFQDFADIINNSNDAKCRNLLNASSSEDTLGWVGFVGGFGLLTFSVIDLVTRVDNSNFDSLQSPSLGPDFAFLGASNLLIVGGGVMFLASHGDFTHAINRYNKLVQKQDATTSFYFVPNPDKPEAGIALRF